VDKDPKVFSASSAAGGADVLFVHVVDDAQALRATTQKMAKRALRHEFRVDMEAP